MKKQYITPATVAIAFATEGIMNNLSKVTIDSGSTGSEQYSIREGAGSAPWSGEDSEADWE